MTTPQDRFRDFFTQYARISLGPTPERLADFYDAGFLVGGPRGGAVFHNDASFLRWLREVHAFNVASGMTLLTPGRMNETPIGAGYTLVAVEWETTFTKTADTIIRFTISYLLRETGAGLKIAAYISPEDQEDVMRTHGLI